MNAWMARAVRPAGWAMLWLCLCCTSAFPRSGEPESRIKAACLARFAGFVEWPDGSFARPDAALRIGVAGNDALAAQVEQMAAGRSVDGHPLTVRSVRRGDSLAGLHILFVGAMERAAVAELLKDAQRRALLTVSDSDTAAALGSMINFVVAGQRLRFEVALKQVAASRLRISARMLAVALRVEGAS